MFTVQKVKVYFLSFKSCVSADQITNQRSFPSDTSYCYTLHMMDNHGDSVSVTKRCSTLENCRFTGCINITHNGFQVGVERLIQMPFLRFVSFADDSLSSDRCARRAARETSAMWWYPGMTAAQCFPSPLLWAARGAGCFLLCCIYSPSSSSAAAGHV